MILKNLSHRSCGLDDFRCSPSAYRDGFTPSYCCEVKYSEKQIDFSHGNSNNLHLLSNSLLAKTWLSTGNRIFSSTAIDTTSMVQVLPNGKSLDFDYLKSRQRRCYTSKILKRTWLLPQATQAGHLRDRN